MRIESDRIFINEQLRNEIFDRDNNTCVNCGSKDNLQVDHIVPFEAGGRTVKENLQTLCRACNIAKREDSKRSNRKDSLTNKQRAFCHEYMIDHNATQSAIRAGYSEDGAQQEGSRLLLNVVVKEYLERLEAEKNIQRELTAEYILARLREKAETAPREADQIRALELLGKHRKLFTEQIDIKDTGKIETIEHK